jgi:hypothetical protein
MRRLAAFMQGKPGALLEKNIAVCYNEANRTQQGEKR